MEGALKMVEKFFSWIFTLIGSLLSLFVFYQYTDLQNLKKEVSEKCVLKSDCQNDFGRLYNDNRQDHQLIFAELKEIRAEMAKNQVLILEKLK